MKLENLKSLLVELEQDELFEVEGGSQKNAAKGFSGTTKPSGGSITVVNRTVPIISWSGC